MENSQVNNDLVSLDLSIMSNDIIDENLFEEDNKKAQIQYAYFFLGKKQLAIAKTYGVTQGYISQVISETKNNPEIQKKLIQVWEKETSIKARAQALQIIESINPKKMIEGSKAQSAGILIDKARLIDGQSTNNILIANIDQEEREALKEIARKMAANLDNK